MEENSIKVCLFLCMKFSKIQSKTLFKISVEWKWKMTQDSYFLLSVGYLQFDDRHRYTYTQVHGNIHLHTIVGNYWITDIYILQLYAIEIIKI